MKNKKKLKEKIIQTSVIYWIGIFLLYTAIIGPLISFIPSWHLAVKIILLILVIALPIVGQIMLVLRLKKEAK